MNQIGISVDQINTKLNTLKLIITNTSDCALLDLLLKSDLNIETAVTRYFGGNTPSPQPNNHNRFPLSSHIEAPDDEASSSNVILSSTASTDDASSSSNSVPSTHNHRRRRRRRQPIISKEELHTVDLLDSIVSSDCHRSGGKSTDPTTKQKENHTPNVIVNPSGTNSESESEINENEPESMKVSEGKENVYIPPRKKRKLNQSERNGITDTSDSNAFNTNSNSSTSSIHTDSNSMNFDSPSADTSSSTATTNLTSIQGFKPKKPLRVDRNWKRKMLGSIRLIYEDLYERRKAESGLTSYKCSYMCWRGELLRYPECLRDSESHNMIRVVSTSPSYADENVEGGALWKEVSRHARATRWDGFPHFKLTENERKSINKDSYEYSVVIDVLCQKDNIHTQNKHMILTLNCHR